jgi:hypothetical protein
MWRVSSHQRHAYCRRFLSGDEAGIERRARAASYTGLQTCGWPGCPCCGPKIAAERGVDIALALSSHHLDGGTVAMVTLTMPHERTHSLQELLEATMKGWTALRQHKTPRALLSAYTVGWIRRLETTVGPHGWHPHVHALLFLPAGVTDEQLSELETALRLSWSNRIERLGYGRPSQKHGVVMRRLDLGAAHEAVADYVAKSAALELASAGTKVSRTADHRTPQQLLYDAGAYGLVGDVALWLEFERTMHGRRHLEWSQGLRRRLIGDVDEVTDQAAAESNDGAARLLTTLSAATWRSVTARPGAPAALLTAAELYEDEDEARDAIARHLSRTRREPARQPASETPSAGREAAGRPPLPAPAGATAGRPPAPHPNASRRVLGTSAARAVATSEAGRINGGTAPIPSRRVTNATQQTDAARSTPTRTQREAGATANGGRAPHHPESRPPGRRSPLHAGRAPDLAG